MHDDGVLAVQLYSVRDRLDGSRRDTLAALARAGFRYVEPFGLGSPTRPLGERLEEASRLRHDLDDAGLLVSAVHTGLGGGAPDGGPHAVEDLARECAELGAEIAIIPHPRHVPGFDQTSFADADQVDALARTLSATARQAADHGLRLGYHNHWFEWAALPDGTTGFDRFWAAAGTELIAEVDLYWAAAAGADPTAVLQGLGDRVLAVHVKDGPARPGEPQTPIGTGVVDIPAILSAVKGIRWHVVEIDSTELDPLELLAGNARALADAGISRW